MLKQMFDFKMETSLCVFIVVHKAKEGKKSLESGILFSPLHISTSICEAHVRIDG